MYWATTLYGKSALGAVAEMAEIYGYARGRSKEHEKYRKLIALQKLSILVIGRADGTIQKKGRE